MTHRRYAIPALSTIAVTVTAGCGARSLTGEWLVTAFEIDGEDYLDDLSQTYEDNGCIYRAEIELTVEFDERDGDDYDGSFEIHYSYGTTGSCGTYSYSYSESYDINASREDNGEWDIEIDDLDVDATCTMEDGELSCDGDVDGEDLEMTLEREDD